MKQKITITESQYKMLTETFATEVKEKLSSKNMIQSWWDLESKLKKEGKLPKGLALTFFCPVYFKGQVIVDKLLDVVDEQGETIIFPLPVITDSARIKTGLNQMKLLGVKNPEKYLKTLKGGKKGLMTFSSLPGIEGVGSGRNYEYIAYEAVQLGAFQIVPEEWVNAGDPYNETYKFPGEDGYSPYWRIPSYQEFKKMRPDLIKGFKKTKNGIIKKFK